MVGRLGSLLGVGEKLIVEGRNQSTLEQVCRRINGRKCRWVCE